MEKIIHKLINEFTEGVDTYTHNDSTWLIFTESKQWVIELTKEKTLWYNYNFFKSVFAYTSLDCVQNQHHITKWVEDNIINGVKRTMSETIPDSFLIEDTIQNGVKKTKMAHMKTDWSVNNTIENGVKETKSDDFNVSQFLCEEVIDKGIKETKISPTHTEYGDWLDGDERLDEIIRDGVKETNHVDVMKFFDNKMEDTLENGIRLTEYQIGDTFDEIDDIIENGVRETIECDWNIPKYVINEVISEGVKETTALDPSFSVRYINGDFEMVPEVEKIIKNGVKYTFNTEYMPKSMVVDIIENGVKSSIPRQYVGENIIDKIINKGITDTIECDWDVPTDLIKDVITEGVKETYDDEYHHKGRIDGVIKNGVKKTHREICEYKNTIDYIIQTGVKKTMSGNYTDPSTSLLHIKWGAQIEDVIDNGNKVCGTYVGGHRQEEKTETVIEYGKQI